MRVRTLRTHSPSTPDYLSEVFGLYEIRGFLINRSLYFLPHCKAWPPPLLRRPTSLLRHPPHCGLDPQSPANKIRMRFRLSGRNEGNVWGTGMLAAMSPPLYLCRNYCTPVNKKNWFYFVLPSSFCNFAAVIGSFQMIKKGIRWESWTVPLL